MRTIKFRGLRTDNNQMIAGQLAYFFDNPKHAMIMPKCYYGTRDFGDEDNNGNPVIEDAMAVGGYYNVKPETISQFTGLHDKNGREIYDGDVVKYYQPYSKTWHEYIVKWDDNWACFGLFEIDNKWCKESDWMKIQQIEVIGNIHENPELK